ncbi:putative transcriptional regulator, XRE family [Parafrankia sp. Ea1.12]|uniref:helix-turn-helix domain-containing protein n=1 Tax=Parafrankia sp. Ea1.12 TaxID=573499 RepID=UPI000DA561B8|nr:helix-turn-helix domain-containing protein [Parafrankia sp. Ea1.12]SQD95665.1 putative transcriptional regulator, XRE family [Parafrankia sp. Ea1.12]
MAQPAPPYTVSPDLLAREEFRAACETLDFQAIFRLMRKYDGASQDRVSSPVRGLTQSRVSRVMSGESNITSLDLVERIADALRIPGAFFRLAPRPWEAETTRADAPPSPALAGIGDHHRASAYATTTAGVSMPAPREPAGDVEDRSLTIDIEVAEDGWATLTYRHELYNGTATPFTRLNRELWFETTNGPLQIESLPSPDRNIIIQRVHDTKLSARFACQVFPAVQPGESVTVGYRSTGGRFVYDHYWRQSIVRPTGTLTIRLRHQGVTSLTRCSATEDRPDGSEISATEGLSFARDEAGVVIELTRRNLRPNQFVTLRWDTAHAST